MRIMVKSRKPVIVVIEPLYLDRMDAAAFLAVSVSTLEQLRRDDPTFPKARELSKRRAGWLVSELKQWGQAQPVAEFLPPSNTRGGTPARMAKAAARKAAAAQQMISQGHVSPDAEG